VNTDSSNFQPLHLFSNPNQGEYPRAGLTLVGSTLYGTTSYDGIGGSGSVYSIDAFAVSASGTTVTFPVGGPAVAVDPSVGLISPNPTLTGATMTISSGTIQPGDTLHFINQNGITGSYSAGVLTLSGAATTAQYQTALQSVTFSSTSTSITTRAIATVAFDGSLVSGAAAESVDVANNVVIASGSTAVFNFGGLPVAVDPGVVISSTDTHLSGAVVTLADYGYDYADTLSFTSPAGSGITGSFSITYYGGAVLTLSGNATVAQYQAALRSVTFTSNSRNASTASLSMYTVDGALNSTPAAETVDLSPGTFIASGAVNTFTVAGSPVSVDPGLTVSTSDSYWTLADVFITSGTLQPGDTLNFTIPAGSSIGGSYGGGVLSLGGAVRPPDSWPSCDRSPSLPPAPTPLPGHSSSTPKITR
jgi:hypothetical protein